MDFPVQDFAVDEFGRVYVCNQHGKPYAGPFDTLAEAEAWLESFENEDDDACDS